MVTISKLIIYEKRNEEDIGCIWFLNRNVPGNSREDWCNKANLFVTHTYIRMPCHMINVNVGRLFC